MKRVFKEIFAVFLKATKDWTSENMLLYNVKFSLYIIFLMVIFGCLARMMISNMQMDIVKALGILNILPTIHLRTNTTFISEMNRSSIIN